MPERSADWIEQSKRDLQMAGEAAATGFPEWACFIAQQAAEKAIKAVYQRRGEVAMGNSVGTLLQGLFGDGNVPTALLKVARNLDRWYIQARYPDGFPQGKPGDYVDREDAEDAISGAGRILQFCKGLLAGH